jgi:hypothetical protein
MSRADVIPHAPKQTLVMIRADYVALCAGNHCAAALLNVLEYWTGVKLGGKDQAQAHNRILTEGGKDPTQNEELWIYKSNAEFVQELLELFKETKVRKALEYLEGRGFVSTRHNPNYGWDRTLQYLLNVENVIDALHTVKITDAFVKSNESIPAKKPNRSVKNNGAIPKTTTEATTKSRTENKDSLSGDKSSQLISAETPPVENGGVVSELSAKDSNPEEPEKKKKERKADPEFDLIAKIWNNTAGGYVSCMQGMIFGSKSVKGEWKKCQFEPAATLDELTTFETYARQRMTEKRMTELPTAAVTIQRWFYDFRAEQERKAAKPKQDAFNPDGWTLPELDGVA